MTAAELKHGRNSTYVGHRCRCAECREAHRVYSLNSRHRQKAQLEVVRAERSQHPTFVAVGDPLIEQLDAFQRLIDDKNEYRRRVWIAAAFVADQPCTCRTPDDDCPKHYLTRVLDGDE